MLDCKSLRDRVVDHTRSKVLQADIKCLQKRGLACVVLADQDRFMPQRYVDVFNASEVLNADVRQADPSLLIGLGRCR